MNPPDKFLADALIDRKILSLQDLEKILPTLNGTPLSKALLDSNIIHPDDITSTEAQRLGFEFTDFSDRFPSPEIKGYISHEIAQRLTVIPLHVTNHTLEVAVIDPTDLDTLRLLEEESGLEISVVVSTKSHIENAIKMLYEQEDQEIQEQSLSISVLLEEVVRAKGSDLHITAGLPPSIRVRGDIIPLPGYPSLTASEIRRMIYEILPQKQREKFEDALELDLSHSVYGLGRFRMNIFLQRDSLGAVMRVIPQDIPSFETLGVPAIVESFASYSRGLVLVTGPTGSGKSTTLASLIDLINSSRQLHIMTIEDPIEFLHLHKKSIVNQREVGVDTLSFNEALKHVLRQDPDVILVGELRDYETMSIAISAAETGHLVFATLHTQDAPQSIDRIIDVFPSSQQQQIRSQLSTALQAIVTQQLIPDATGKSRVAACEVLVATPAVRNLIREGKTHQIYSSMQAGGQFGMQTMDMALSNLVKTRKITKEIAKEHAHNLADITRLLQ